MPAVIFDMDGLLIDSEPLWVRAEIEVFGAVGLPLTEAECGRTKGLRVDDVVRHWQELAPATSELRRLQASAVANQLVARLVDLVGEEGRALPGVASALAAARAGGRRLALASSSPQRIIDAALARLDLGGAFDVVQSAETESHGKPHPAIFLRTAERLGVGPADCVVVEDSLHGVVAAKAARMRCIAVPFDHPHHPAGFAVADLIVGSLKELTPASFAVF